MQPARKLADGVSTEISLSASASPVCGAVNGVNEDCEKDVILVYYY